MNKQATVKRKSAISRLFEIAGEKKLLLILSGIVSVISTIMLFIPYVAVYFIVNELLKHATNPAMSNTILIEQWAVRALITTFIGLGLLYASSMLSHVSAFKILYNLRMRLCEHMAKLPMGYHNQQSTGAIKKTLEYSVEQIEGFVAHQIPDLVSAFVLPILMLVTMFILDWRLALATSVPIIAAFLLQTLVFSGNNGKKNMRLYHDALENMNANGVEYVRGMPAVKVFGMTVYTFKAFRNSILQYKDWILKFTSFCKKPYVVFLVILSSIGAFIAPIGVYLLSGQPSNQAFALTLLLFLIIAPGLSSPMLKLMYVGGNMRMISEGVTRMDQIFNEKPLVEPDIPFKPQNHSIVFDNVNFSYDKEDESTRIKALTKISFEAKEGEMTALVGPSGSGKTTIANLIPRFWDVEDGQIHIGGINIKDIGTKNLMGAVSFVFQDVHLFYDTIEENIRMGNSEATQQQVISAAKAACCHEFIERLPKGYKTKIGEGGTYLSGGEAQRISIARAILKNAPILVLDEATAFADPENEVKIQQALSTLIKQKTVIVIAHRLSTIRQADQILVIKEGEIAEHGKHNELLSLKGVYKKMWDAHMDAGDWKIILDNEEERRHLA
jgi:ATP-binding cassette, subfamily B, bacterial IrtA/YbtP